MLPLDCLVRIVFNAPAVPWSRVLRARSPAVLPRPARRRTKTGASTCARAFRAAGWRSRGSTWNRGNGGTGETELRERGDDALQNNLVKRREVAQNGLQRADLVAGLGQQHRQQQRVVVSRGEQALVEVLQNEEQHG